MLFFRHSWSDAGMVQICSPPEEQLTLLFSYNFVGQSTQIILWNLYHSILQSETVSNIRAFTKLGTCPLLVYQRMLFTCKTSTYESTPKQICQVDENVKCQPGPFRRQLGKPILVLRSYPTQCRRMTFMKNLV